MIIDTSKQPPIIRAALEAIIEFDEQYADEIGYDCSYYLHDLPKVVREAIEPWRELFT